jgi:hypothetical protein
MIYAGIHSVKTVLITWEAVITPGEAKRPSPYFYSTACAGRGVLQAEVSEMLF